MDEKKFLESVAVYKETLKDIEFKDLYVYAYPFVLIFFLVTISETIDKFLFNKYFDLKTLGLYNFSAVIVTPVAILIQSYWNSVTPAMYKLVSQDQDGKEQMLGTYFNGLLLITLVAIWGVIMVIDPVIKVVANKSYHGATYFVPLLAVAVLGKAYFNIYTFNASFYKKTKLLPLINVASIIFGLATALGLMELLGIWAILISVIASRIVQGVAAYFLEKSLGLHFYSIMNQAGLVVLTFIIVSINYLFLYEQEYLEIWQVNAIEGIIFFCILALLNKQNLTRVYHYILN